MKAQQIRMIVLGALVLNFVATLFGCRTKPHSKGSSPPPGFAPDFIVSWVHATNAASRGSSLVYTDCTKNVGNRIATESLSYVYLCTSSNSLSGACLRTNHIVGTIAINGLSTNWGTCTVPSSAALGTNYICSVADATNGIPELKEYNNTNCTMILINP